MVKKKKSKSTVNESVVSGAKRDEPQLRPLHELLAAEDDGLPLLPLPASISGLLGALKNEKILENESMRNSLICESLIIALFTTRSGFTVLSFLSDLPGKTKNLRKKWKTDYRSKTFHALILQDWQTNEMILLKFLSFLMENRNAHLHWEEFNKPRWKLPLLFLIESKYAAASIILDEQYNLLLDYIFSVTPVLKSWLQKALNHENGLFFKKTVCYYKRLFELTNYSSWYTLSMDRKDTKYHRDMLKGVFQENSENVLPVLDELYNSSLSSEFQRKSKTSESEIVSYHHRVSQEENVYSFDLNQDGSLDLPNIMSHASLRHDILLDLLRLPAFDSPLLQLQFKVMAGLVDPLTQPAPNDKHVISIDLIYQMFLGLLTPEIQNVLDLNDGCDWKFHVSFNMQKIIQASQIRLNFVDYEKLNSINNSDEAISWKSNLNKWLPHGLNTQNLELIYMIDILAVYAIYRLNDHLPIQMNPFLSTLISLWKNLTCVILLGLEIDRIEEEHETFETPLLVRATIRGATALRAVVATVLNGHVEHNKHDFEHEPFNTFMSPHGRKLCQGALYADLRSHAAALLALGTELEDVTTLLADLQAGDRFDEDVRYMFEYECDDYADNVPRHEEASVGNEKEESISTYPKNMQRRCHCIFDDDEMAEDREPTGEYDEAFFSKQMIQQQQAQASLSMSSNGKPRAIRSTGSFEFDYSGKDWRDIPRGQNFYYSPDYQFIEKPSFNTILSLTMKASSETLDEKESVLLLTSVASCVKNEQDEITLGNLIEAHNEYQSDDQASTSTGEKVGKIDPDDIYELWCDNSTFEKMVYWNHTLSWRLMDEMLLCIGYRRVLIWFVTHLELNHSLIHYIFELVMGLRGQSDDDHQRSTKAPGGSNQEGETTKKVDISHVLRFSRQGALQLSIIETKMLLQEFFTNAAIFLSKKTDDNASVPDINGDDGDDGEGSGNLENVSLYAVGLMKLICFMVKTFINKGKFDFSESECVFELQALLMNWIGIIPEARELFFHLKSLIAELNKDSDTDETRSENGIRREPPRMSDTPEIDSAADFEYNRKLMSLLPPLVKNKEENAAMQTLRNFITTNSFSTTVPVIGRKIVHEDDIILPLSKSDVPMGLSEYLTDYDDNYNYVSGEEYEYEYEYE